MNPLFQTNRGPCYERRNELIDPSWCLTQSYSIIWEESELICPHKGDKVLGALSILDPCPTWLAKASWKMTYSWIHLIQPLLNLTELNSFHLISKLSF